MKGSNDLVLQILQKLVTELKKQGVDTASVNLDAWHTLPKERLNRDNLAEHFYHHAFQLDDLFQALTPVDRSVKN